METWPVSLPEIKLWQQQLKKERKSRYQFFLALSNFTGFLYFALNILTGILVFILVKKLLTESIS